MVQYFLHIFFNKTGFGDESIISNLRSSFARELPNIKAFYHPADLSKPSEIEDMIRFANEKLGSVDILVNNAGIQYTASVETFPPEKYDQIIAINQSSVFHTIRLVLPKMREQNWGRILVSNFSNFSNF